MQKSFIFTNFMLLSVCMNCLFRSLIKLVLLLFLCSITVSCLQAQTSIWDSGSETKKKTKEKVANGQRSYKNWKDHIKNQGKENNYTHHFAAGAKLNSNGWSGALYLLKRKSVGACHLFQLYFSEIKHEKQIKQQKISAYPQFGASTPFVYGKVNNLYTLQSGYGRESLLLPGIVEDNLSVSFRYSAGFSLALLKPYYLKLVYTDYANGLPPILKEQRFTDTTAEPFLNTNNIFGGGRWSKGLTEIKLVPGIFGEASFAIDVANSKVFVQSITIGANGAYYPDKLPVMAELEASNVQGSVFVGLSLGKKWRKLY